jgi:ankyrin repeat protein
MAAAAAASPLPRRRAAAALLLPLLPLLLLLTTRGALAQGGEAPPTANPYANRNWSGCEHGYCPPVDAAVERQFFAAAAAGDVPELKRLMREHGSKSSTGHREDEQAPVALNLTRNIVPDDSGHARVLDVAIWAAVRAGKSEAVRLLFQSLPDAKQAEEEGHMVELAADNGDLDMLNLLLDDEDRSVSKRFSKGGLDMPMGPSALAHAALKGNVPAMKLLLERDTARVKREMAMGGRVTRPPLDLKAGMGAASRSGSVEAIQAMVEAGGMAAPHHPVTGKASVYDWQGEFVEEALGAAAFEARTQWRAGLVPIRPPSAEAVAAANAKAIAAERSTAARGSLAAALRLLLEGGNYTVPWAKAQGLVASAARAGDPGALALLFEQPTIGGDPDELAEAAQRALGVAAEEGRPAVVKWVLETHGSDARKACGMALKRAVMYDHPEALDAVLTGGKGVCANATVTSATARLASFQDAGWLGAVLSASRRGADDALEALLAGKVAAVGAEKTAKLLGAYHTVRSAGEDEPEDGQGKPPAEAPQRQDRDPLAAAAARGDARAVKALLPLSSGLCTSCAAVEAARGGHLELLKLLTKGEQEEGEKEKDGKNKKNRGVAASVLEQESTGGATDGLRCLAQALDQGQWSVIEWLAGEHQKGKHLLAYFLSAIAQHVDVGNMERMVGVLERAIVEGGGGGEEGEGDEGGDGGDGDDGKKKKKRRAPRLLPGLDPQEISYVRDQMHSATVSAALKGQPGMLATLQGSRLAKALAAEARRQRAMQKREEEEEARNREAERAYNEAKKKREEEEEAAAEAKKKEEL